MFGCWLSTTTSTEALAEPALSVAVQVSCTRPGMPAVYVTRLRPPLIRPGTGVVSVPLDTLQRYMVPGRMTVETMRPVAPAVTGLTAVMMGVGVPPSDGPLPPSVDPWHVPALQLSAPQLKHCPPPPPHDEAEPPGWQVPD